MATQIPYQALLSLYCATMQLTLQVDYLECLNQRVMSLENQTCLTRQHHQIWTDSCVQDQTMNILMRGFVHRVTQIYPKLPEPPTDIYSTTNSYLLAHDICEDVRYFSKYPTDLLPSSEEAVPAWTGEPSGEVVTPTPGATSGATSGASRGARPVFSYK